MIKAPSSSPPIAAPIAAPATVPVLTPLLFDATAPVELVADPSLEDVPEGNCADDADDNDDSNDDDEDAKDDEDDAAAPVAARLPVLDSAPCVTDDSPELDTAVLASDWDAGTSVVTVVGIPAESNVEIVVTMLLCAWLLFTSPCLFSIVSELFTGGQCSGKLSTICKLVKHSKITSAVPTIGRDCV